MINDINGSRIGAHVSFLPSILVNNELAYWKVYMLA